MDWINLYWVRAVGGLLLTRYYKTMGNSLVAERLVAPQGHSSVELVKQPRELTVIKA
jgi:hypothetical protein